MDAMEARHKLEIQELENKSKAMLKGASKKDRIVLEAQIIQVNIFYIMQMKSLYCKNSDANHVIDILQMEFDLKAKHREEEDELEQQLGEFYFFVALNLIYH